MLQPVQSCLYISSNALTTTAKWNSGATSTFHATASVFQSVTVILASKNTVCRMLVSLLASHLSCLLPYKTGIIKERSVQNIYLDIDCLLSFNRRTLEEKLALLDKDFEAWVIFLHLLFIIRVYCCEAGMTLFSEMKKERVQGSRYFRCKKRECPKKVGFYSGTFFKSLKDFFCLSAYQAKYRRFTYEDIRAEMLRKTRSKLGFYTS